MRILNLHGFLGAADNKNYKALCGLIAPEQIVSPKLDYLHTAPDDLLRQLAETAADPDFICRAEPRRTVRRPSEPPHGPPLHPDESLLLSAHAFADCG